MVACCIYQRRTMRIMPSMFMILDEIWYNDGIYSYYLASETMNWTASVEQCKRRDAKLAVVPTRAEQSYLSKLILDRYMMCMFHCTVQLLLVTIFVFIPCNVMSSEAQP